ncbi:transposase [Staphylococcus pasteuri]|nr:transposase [Staphylococcus pasteuri]
MKNRSYSRDFKVSVLKIRQENHLSYREITNYFNISNLSMIANWQRKFDEESILGLDNKQRERTSKIKKKNRKVK